MHHVPKAIYAIMGAVLLVGLFFRLTSASGNTRTPSYGDQSSLYQALTENTPSPANADDPASWIASLMGKGGATGQETIDLQGPWVCQYRDEEIEIGLKIKDSNIAAQFRGVEAEMKFVLVDGTLYQWIPGQLSGTKIEGIGQYTGLFDSFSAFVSPDMLFSFIPDILGSESITKERLAGLKDSCREEAVGQEVFVLPKNVTFELMDQNTVVDGE